MDHARVTISTSSISCGVLELSRINDDMEGVLYCIASRLYHPSRGEPAAMAIWSDVAVEKTNSQALYDIVFRFSFHSTLNRTNIVENPKTGNLIRLFCWSFDHEKFKQWYSRKRVENLGKVGS